MNPNDPAFPQEQAAVLIQNGLTEEFPGLEGRIQTIGHQCAGLTKREYFAALAMQGMLAGGKLPNINGDPISHDRAAVLLADALIAELSK